MIALVARALRLLLIVLAARYLWKALRSPSAPPPRAPGEPPHPRTHPEIGDAEDIDYEDIT